MSNGGPQKDAPANRGCRGIGVGLLADGQLIQIVDDPVLPPFASGTFAEAVGARE